MNAQLIGGIIIVAFGILGLTLTRWSVAVRVRWFEEHMPNLGINRTAETVGYVIGMLVAIAFGAFLIVGA